MGVEVRKPRGQNSAAVPLNKPATKCYRKEKKIKAICQNAERNPTETNFTGSAFLKDINIWRRIIPIITQGEKSIMALNIQSHVE